MGLRCQVSHPHPSGNGMLVKASEMSDDPSSGSPLTGSQEEDQQIGILPSPGMHDSLGWLDLLW